MTFGIQINKNNTEFLSLQLIKIIRNKILSGELTGGEKLPPTRNLATELGVARNTVIIAYEQLEAEGYLESRKGSGTYIVHLNGFRLSKLHNYRSKVFSTIDTSPQNTIIFDTGCPDNSCFPSIQWGKALKTACLSASAKAFGYSSASGDMKLKQALCEYLYRSKGMLCHPENIFIISGTSGGLNLISEVFDIHSRRIAIEDPCMDFVKNIFNKRGYTISPIPVDNQGIKTDFINNIPLQSLIYTVPSHQFPTGAILSASRRMELLKYANETDTYIIEDDYDSEFNYNTRPIQSLYNLDSEHTIYIGTFSKIFSPAIRLGYMILPKRLYEKVEVAAEEMNVHTDTVTQLAMAEYINDKNLDRHIFKMKRIYEQKRKYLIECLYSTFNERLTISGENAGLHLMTTFERNFSDTDFKNFLQFGVSVECVENYSINKGIYQNKLIFGYGNLSLTQIKLGVEKLKEAIETSL